MSREGGRRGRGEQGGGRRGRGEQGGGGEDSNPQLPVFSTSILHVARCSTN